VDGSHVIIITGAGGGLGGAMARGLFDAGQRIVAVDIEGGAFGLDTLATYADAHGGADRVLTTIASIRSAEQCRAVVAATLERFRELHGLINNAAVPPFRNPDMSRPTFLNVPLDYWELGVDTNLNGPFRMTQAAGPYLVERGWGRIVNVTTSLTTMLAPGATPYGATKAGLEAASSIWSKELAPSGVSVNVLVPGGAADTPFVPLAAVPDRGTLIPAGVMVGPIVWLMSRAADGFTGQRIIGNRWVPEAAIADNLRASAAPIAW
jgi:NAD(P)-dependent dehydrogenase (short-subunit alcohol dehydrogenase family)